MQYSYLNIIKGSFYTRNKFILTYSLYKNFIIFYTIFLTLIKFKFTLLVFICIITSDVVIFSVEASNQNNNETNNSNEQTDSQVDKYGYLQPVKDIGIPLITLLGGILSAKFIVGSWQTRKEISDLRKEILSDYTITFKNYVILLDTFVLKLVIQLVKIDNQILLNKPRLCKLMPWEYTYEGLIKYAKKIREVKNLIDFGNELLPEDEEPYKNETIVEKLEELYTENNNCYIDFSSQALNEFRKNSEPAFQARFYDTRDIVTGFSGTSQSILRRQ